MDTHDQHTEKMIALGRITRALIHDFNNSLASIMGHADFLIADLPKDSEQHAFAENIKRTAVQLQSSLDQIRSFAADKQDIHKITAPPAPSQGSIPRSILLVEDREMVRQTIATMLLREKHIVESVTDGFLALDMIRENPTKYDLLITDYTMPTMNGKDLVAEIRQDFKTIPVIIMSGDAESLSDLKNDPGNTHIFVLQKPITAADLSCVIATAQKKGRKPKF